MAADQEHAQLLACVTACGGSFFQAAFDNPAIFEGYFLAHIRLAWVAHGDCYPYAHNVEGAFLIAALRLYGWWHNDDEDKTYTAAGTDSTKAVVFALDAARLAEIKAHAETDGLTVVRSVRMDTNEVIDY